MNSLSPVTGGGYDLTSPGNVVWTLADNEGTIRDLATYNAQTGVTTVANHRVVRQLRQPHIADQRRRRLPLRVYGIGLRQGQRDERDAHPAIRPDHGPVGQPGYGRFRGGDTEPISILREQPDK